jgi:hypothetical protein
MNQYVIRTLDRQGRVALVQGVLCRDDLDALAQGERRSGQNDVEIWQGDRLVARIKLGNAALDAQDARSL